MDSTHSLKWEGTVHAIQSCLIFAAYLLVPTGSPPGYPPVDTHVFCKDPPHPPKHLYLRLLFLFVLKFTSVSIGMGLLGKHNFCHTLIYFCELKNRSTGLWTLCCSEIRLRQILQLGYNISEVIRKSAHRTEITSVRKKSDRREGPRAQISNRSLVLVGQGSGVLVNSKTSRKLLIRMTVTVILYRDNTQW